MDARHIAAVMAMPIFGGLSDDQLRCLQGDLQRRNVPALTSLVQCGRPNDRVYFLVRGSVKVFIEAEHGRSLALNLLGPGEVLGEMSASEGARASASALTVEAGELLSMEGAAFERALTAMAPLAMNMLRLQNRRLRRLTARVVSIVSLEVPQRVASELLHFAEDYCAPQVAAGNEATAGGASVMCTLPMRIRQSDLGELIGASREAVNRTFAALRRQGLISLDANHHIQLHDLAALRLMCAPGH